MEALRGRRSLDGALAAITAAVVGVVLNLALWFGLHVVFTEQSEHAFGPLALELPLLASVDWLAFGITCAALVALLRFHVGMLTTLAASALIGVIGRWIAAAS
jgi:chromate transporter